MFKLLLYFQNANFEFPSSWTLWVLLVSMNVANEKEKTLLQELKLFFVWTLLRGSSKILSSIVPKKMHQKNARKQFSQWDSPLTIYCFENMIIWGNKMLKKWEADDIFRKSTAKNVITQTFSEKMVHCQHKVLSK